jgi:hypothetical protein
MRQPHYHIAHRSEVDGRVVNAGEEPEVWSSRESASERIDRILRDIRSRRRVVILRDHDWVQVSWRDEHVVTHLFRLIECSKERCLEVFTG